MIESENAAKHLGHCMAVNKVSWKWGKGSLWSGWQQRRREKYPASDDGWNYKAR